MNCKLDDSRKEKYFQNMIAFEELKCTLTTLAEWK